MVRVGRLQRVDVTSAKVPGVHQVRSTPGENGPILSLGQHIRQNVKLKIDKCTASLLRLYAMPSVALPAALLFAAAFYACLGTRRIGVWLAPSWLAMAGPGIQPDRSVECHVCRAQQASS
jgi:hypothetical protein